MREVYNAPAILVIGNDPTDQHPLLAWQIRNNVRLHRSRLYLINSQAIKLRTAGGRVHAMSSGAEGKAAAFLAGEDAAVDGLISENTNREGWFALRDKLRGEQNLVIVFGSEIRGNDVAALVKFGSAISGAKFVCLADYANSRGAADMGLYPDLLPGYHRVSDTGKFHQEWGNVPPQLD